jgi:hypothetical protein
MAESDQTAPPPSPHPPAVDPPVVIPHVDFSSSHPDRLVDVRKGMGLGDVGATGPTPPAPPPPPSRETGES